MDVIVPRWEWRTFGASFGDADARFSELSPTASQDSEEVYLLSPSCDANVKIRDRLMDIKTLERVDANGLEQWRPVMKGKFPLAPADAEGVCTALRVTPLSLRDGYQWEGMEAELVRPSRGVHVAHVRKTRRRYTIDGCLAEIADVIADGHPTRTVAIEFEDPARVYAAVQKMGLGRFENVSYPRGLKRLLGLTT